MPTGYTADVAEGKVTDFRTFALRCARNFGATIMQRDDPMNEPPKMRVVEPYYHEAIARAEARVAELDGMTLSQADAAAQAEYDRAVRERAESDARHAETRNRYNAMLSRAVAWQAPTEEHAGLRSFMIQQLTESRKWDCGEYERDALVRLSGPAWLAAQWADAVRAVNRSKASLAEEEARCAGANAWITALYDSLAAVSA